MLFGFPTGKLNDLTLQQAVDRNYECFSDCIEFSGIRFTEFEQLLKDYSEVHIPLPMWSRVSIHLPANTDKDQEKEVVRLIHAYKAYKPMVLHADSIHDYDLWRPFGSLVRVENMDLRKKFGTSVSDMQQVFNFLEEAHFCFDIGHARQVDPSMEMAIEMHERFYDRMSHMHMSVVEPSGKHAAMTLDAVRDYRYVLRRRDKKRTVILETPMDDRLAYHLNIMYAQQSFA